MASLLIHMAVATEVNKKIKRDNDKLLIGTMAPDLSKIMGESRSYSHFIFDDSDIPNINAFLSKYKDKLDDDFVMGYFIHLYTDYLWFKYFVVEFYDKLKITKLDGTVVNCYGNMASMYIYNDYTNINEKILNEYDMDLKFLDNLPPIESPINEFSVEKIDLLIEKAKIIMLKTKEKKSYLFDIDNIKSFIQTSTDLIVAKIEELDKVI